jgi:diguanylate cyclase (GGDEF)-like protein
VHVVAAIAVSLAALIGWLLGGWTHQLSRDESVLLLLTALAVMSVGRAAAAAQGRIRFAWLTLMVGLLGWAAGGAIWVWFEVNAQSKPFPSAADVGFIVLPVCAILALMMFPTTDGPHRARYLLDGFLVSGSLFVIAWVLLIDRIRDIVAADRLGIVVSLAYPIFDLVALTIAAALLSRIRSDQRMTVTLLTLGLMAMWFSRGAFIYLAAEQRVGGDYATDVGWVVGLLLITVAAAIDRGEDQPDKADVTGPGWASIWLPYGLLAVAALGAFLLPSSSLRDGPVVVVAAMLVVAVLARQFLAFGENRRLLAAAAEQSLRDPLTGVANRALLDYRLEQAMRRRESQGTWVGVSTLDVDDFKLLNDTLGHPVGDALLVDIGRRLIETVGTAGTVARLGGDEFAVVTEGTVEHARQVDQQVYGIFTEPFVIDTHELFMNASVGLALADPDDQKLSAEDVLKLADLAMYAGKRSRADGVQTFNHDLESDGVDTSLFKRSDQKISGAATVRLLGELRHAIDHGELALVYQPKYDLRTLKVMGVEALLRWPHPRLGLLAPKHFLPLVRRHGLIRPITEFVIRKALEDASRWNSAWEGVGVAVNLFAPSLADLHLRDMIISALGEYGLDGHALTVEITEDLVLDDIGMARSILNRLREHGIKVAIDDFGSGYAALSYLRDLPIDEVKLDRNFIAPILIDQRAAAVVKAVVDLAHVLGLTTVAEGIENAQTAERLRELGCDTAQGFYFSRPVPSEQLVTLPKVAATPELAPVSALSS